MKERLGRETVKDFDACALTLAEARDAVCTRSGVVYDRAAILESLASQREAIERKLRAWERAREAAAREADEREAKRRKTALETFHAENHVGVGSIGGSANGDASTADESAYSGAASRQAIELNAKRTESLDAFWRIDGGVRDDLKHDLEKPNTDTRCPATLEKLRMKDLITIKWTKVRPGESGKYMCPITFKTFTNSSTIVVLKPTGDAMSEDGYKATVEKEGSYNGVSIRPKDVIKLQRGGTGFAGSGTQVESKAEFALGIGGGGDLRGQNRNSQSKFGLRFA